VQGGGPQAFHEVIKDACHTLFKHRSPSRLTDRNDVIDLIELTYRSMHYSDGTPMTDFGKVVTRWLQMKGR
jgi:hypothetical protein